MRTRLLTLLLPLLATLGFAPSAMGVTSPATITTQLDTQVITVGQEFKASITVDATGGLYSRSFTITPNPGFAITGVGLPSGQASTSINGSSRTIPVALTDAGATWTVGFTAPPNAGDAVPFQISNAGPVNLGLVPTMTVAPVVVTFGAVSKVLFPGSTGASATTRVQVAAAQGAPQTLVNSVTVIPAAPAGIGVGTVDTAAAFDAVVTAGPGAAVGPNVIGGSGSVVKVGGASVSATVATTTLTLANRPRLTITGLPAGMLVGDTATVTVSLSHDSGVSLSAVSVSLAAQGLSLDAASWSLPLTLPGASGVGTSSATATVTATAPGTGTLTAKYSLGGDTTQTATTSISVRQPTSQPTVAIGFRALSPSPFGRKSHRLGFKGELVNTAGGSPAALPAAWCTSSRLGLVLRLEQKLPGTKKWRKIAGKATIKPKFTGGRCTIAWGQGKSLGARNNGVKLRYQLGVTPKGTVPGFASPSVSTLTLGVLNIG